MITLSSTKRFFIRCVTFVIPVPKASLIHKLRIKNILIFTQPHVWRLRDERTISVWQEEGGPIKTLQLINHML